MFHILSISLKASVAFLLRMTFQLFNEDCFEWLKSSSPGSFEAIVTDPPYGVREYTPIELEKMRKRSGGIWRIPMRIGGYERNLLPRFTALTEKDIVDLNRFFRDFAEVAFNVVVPGAHMFMASTSLVSHHVVNSVTAAGFEFRGTLIRVVRTFRGGDRPKGAEVEFRDVSAMPRGCWEPWLLFRRPLEGTLAENLRKWRTGGLRRFSAQTPFLDLIHVGKTPRIERDISRHPSVKPQQLMRLVVRCSLPLGEGRILDPFAGCGSTLAAAESQGIDSVGVEIDRQYYETALEAIPKLAQLKTKPLFTQSRERGPLDEYP